MTVGDKPLVSVIMNCYNGEEFLSEAINSVLAQTYDNWELIFWDNLSSDKSKEIKENIDKHLVPALPVDVEINHIQLDISDDQLKNYKDKLQTLQN